jgi:NitT/TauT family transport system substrate-binding protein
VRANQKREDRFVKDKRLWLLVALALAALALVVAGCGGDDEEEAGGDATTPAETTGEEQVETADVTLQLKWVTQGQFAGYYAALEQGYYEEEGLNVTIKPGGPDIVPEQVVLGGQAEFGINWLDNTLATRDQGGKIINIAQVFARSGMTELTWADSGLDSIEDLKGKKVGVWLGGNEHKLFAALTKNGIDPQKDAQIVAQPFDMNLFLNREVDAAAAMTYNELAQVLETKNPDTGELYTLEDLNVMKMSDLGTGALEDGIFVTEEWIADEANQDIAKRFLKASFKGWAYCRDNPDDCVGYVLDAGPTLGEGHQRWMVNEINKLIWPNESGIGVMNESDYENTVGIATDYGIVKNEPGEGVYRTDLAEAAVAELEEEGVDVNGADWSAPEVEVTEGGE